MAIEKSPRFVSKSNASPPRSWGTGWTGFFKGEIIRLARLLSALLATAGIASACTVAPLEPYTEDTPPLVLLPASQAGIEDRRARFREIFCAILEQRGQTLPDYRSCDEALTTLGAELAGSGKEVYLGPSRHNLVAVTVPGVGWSCFADWLDVEKTARDHVRKYGFDMRILEVDALSSPTANARQIRDRIIAMGEAGDKPKLVLIGYSKGAPDILESVVSYPEIRKHIAAVISAGGAVGGSPLANDATQSQLELLKHWPDAKCASGDGGAVESLRPAVRKAWLAQNRLPDEIPYYSLVTYPKPERISTILQPSYDKLSQVDARNDSQLIFYDQVIPGSSLLGYINADHWALYVPVARSHTAIGSTFVDENDYPREALLEALLRFVEEELEMKEER